MTTERQRAANRANAAKSTGPRTENGKRRAQGNAQRHGLSRPPQRADVAAWYKTITGRRLDVEALPIGEEERAALALAEAEAHLANAVREEERFLEALETGEDLELQLRFIKRVVTQYRTPRVSPSVRHRHHLGPARSLKPSKVKITMKSIEPQVRHHGIAKYRIAAEVRRHKALEAWISLLRDPQEFVRMPVTDADNACVRHGRSQRDSETKPNSTSD